MANWIKAIYFVVILAWVIYVLSDDAVKYKSYVVWDQACLHHSSYRDRQGVYSVPLCLRSSE